MGLNYSYNLGRSTNGHSSQMDGDFSRTDRPPEIKDVFDSVADNQLPNNDELIPPFSPTCQLSDLSRPAKLTTQAATRIVSENQTPAGPATETRSGDPIKSFAGLVGTASLVGLTGGALCCLIEVLLAEGVASGAYNPLAEYLQVLDGIKNFALFELGQVDQIVLHPAAEAMTQLEAQGTEIDTLKREWVLYRLLQGDLPASVVPAAIMGVCVTTLLWCVARATSHN
jgi:hypothetical protein